MKNALAAGILALCGLNLPVLAQEHDLPEMPEVIGTLWQVEVLGGQPLAADQPTLQFDGQGRVAGLGGCNRYFGAVTLAADALVIGAIGATKMACAPDAMQIESAFLDALATVTMLGLDAQGALVLSDADGIEVLRAVALAGQDGGP